MKVMGQKILLVQNKTTTETEGGIVLPDQTVQLLPSGVIARCGPECKEVKVGDRVLVNDVAALKVEVNKENFIILDEEDVLVILEEGEV